MILTLQIPPQYECPNQPNWRQCHSLRSILPRQLHTTPLAKAVVFLLYTLILWIGKKCFLQWQCNTVDMPHHCRQWDQTLEETGQTKNRCSSCACLQNIHGNTPLASRLLKVGNRLWASFHTWDYCTFAGTYLSHKDL